MKAKPYLSAALFLLTASCGSSEVSTTESVLTPAEVMSLEARSSANDMMAMKELQLHYDFEGMDKEWEEIHQKLLHLDDPDAIETEATRLVSLSKRTEQNKEKRMLLNKALVFAEKAASLREHNDTSTDGTVQVVRRYQEKLDSGT